MTANQAQPIDPGQTATFGDVRAILHGSTPGPETWQSLLEAIDCYRGAEPLEDVVLPYCANQLERWPDDIPRLPPRAWLKDILRGEHEPRMLLANRLDLRWESIYPDQLGRINDSGLLRHINTIDSAGRGLRSATLRYLHLCDQMPSLRRLDLSQASFDQDAVSSLRRAPFWPQLTSLQLERAQLESAGALLLADAPPTQLIELNLVHNDLRASAIGALARAPGLAKLQQLDLGVNHAGPQGCRAIAESERLPRLQSLSLHDNRILNQGATALAESPQLRSLRRLVLSQNNIEARGLRAICASPHLTNLRELVLRYNPLGPDSGQLLATAPFLQTLQLLDLRQSFMTPQALGQLIDSGRLTNLRSLDLSSNELGLDGLQRLLDSPIPDGLLELNLSFSELGDEGCRALLASPRLRRCRRLALNSNQITADGLRTLLQAEHLQLQHLSLDFNPLGNRGAAILANAPALQHLETLSLHHCEIHEAGAQALADSPYLPQALKHIRWRV